MTEEGKIIILDDLPQEVKVRLQATYDEVNSISDLVESIQRTNIQGRFGFKFEQGAPLPLLTPLERAQSVCFIIRYEHLPVLERIDILEHKGRFYLKNIDFIRHVLNEYRSIIANTRDSIYYSKVHKICYKKLMKRDASTGLTISVDHETEGDITDEFIKVLGESNKSIKFILKNCEFDYIYNGIIQHSDQKYTKRFWEDYHSGRINHIFIKHAFLLGHVKDALFWHHHILNYLTFPKLGPL